MNCQTTINAATTDGAAHHGSLSRSKGLDLAAGVLLGLASVGFASLVTNFLKMWFLRKARQEFQMPLQEPQTKRNKDTSSDETTSSFADAMKNRKAMWMMTSPATQKQAINNDLNTSTFTLESMILSPEIKDSLLIIVKHEQAKADLFGKWGFETIHNAALFCGVPGTGKTMAAE